jgi:phosphatidylserine decarboxylase
MKSLLSALFFSISLITLPQAAAAKPVVDAGLEPCGYSIGFLQLYYENDAAFRDLIDTAFRNQQQLPPEYEDGNPWIGGNFDDLVGFFREWCTFLPTIQGTSDTGLEYIQRFAWFYYRNPYGVQFVQENPGRKITQLFAMERGLYLDSPDSTREIANWLKDERIEKEDYNLPDPTAPDGGFKSFNDFFSRTLKDQAKSRPQTMPERDYIIAAPTDCIMNAIPMKIVDADTKIPTKMGQALNISEMLDGSAHAGKFVGGTALSCVLMPNTYHHYHSPVSGHVVESRIIHDAFYGYDDFPKWVPKNGNVGYYGTDFSQFENFQRGYFIVDTGKFGHVAMIPVGLDTISSIQFKEKFVDIKEPVPVTRGDELGYFLYGGSLFIMVFEPGRYASDAIQVRLGNQIGTFDTKSDKD